MNEEIKDTAKTVPAVKARSRASSYAAPYSIRQISTDDEHRYDTGCHELNRVLGELGEKYGVPKTAIAIAWILRHPARMQAIAGTMNPQHLKDICAAASVRLTHHEWYELYLASGKFLP